ncbi:LytR C-terminal domain-containing protein [Candidatus Woesebacteria bacterium]|nr:LytR C-terminal domain-containing protein [Candidatus Woesebacteria bacterium]
MVYLYVGKNSVKSLGFTKTLLGQFSIAHFSKTHASDFILDGRFQSVDLIASAIKESLTNATPQQITDKEVCLILPQDVFSFGRYTVPTDISESAIMPFVKDKVRNELKISLETTHHDYYVKSNESESTVFFYGIDHEVLQPLSEALGLLQLKIARIVPESIAYYTLFEKTLRADKKENILFASYNEHESFAYIYDSLGLTHDKKIPLDEDIKPALKEVVAKQEKDNAKINRLILSGTQSNTVRQDLFTKDVGAWTNPLEKIIDTFYRDALKMIIPSGSENISVISYDVCFGAFIFTESHKDFTLLNQGMTGSSSGRRMPSLSMPSGGGILREIFNMKTVLIFVGSFALTFGIIYGLSKMNLAEFSLNLPTKDAKKIEIAEKPTPLPSKKPTPTPSVARDELKVKLLNGSGTKGKATEVKEILEEAGFTDIVTGNADTFDYTKTEVQIKKESSDALSLIQNDLKDYVSISDAAELDEEETADIVIIIGTDFE